MSEDALREELRIARLAHTICDRERQEALDKIRELQELTPAHDEDYRYRVEQIAAQIVAEGWITESSEDALVKDAIRVARKLVCAVEAMDRG